MGVEKFPVSTLVLTGLVSNCVLDVFCMAAAILVIVETPNQKAKQGQNIIHIT